MKNKKQKIAIVSVLVLLVVSIVSGLVQPYLQNKNASTIGPGRLQQDELIAVPDFRFTDSDGNTVHFDDFKGKPIVMNFWGTWCPYCVQEMPDFNKLAGEYGDKVIFLFLDVPNSADETVEKVEQFLSDNNLTNITSHYDSFAEGCYMFGLSSFPTTIYVDKDGYLYDAAIGKTNYDAVKEIIETMI